LPEISGVGFLYFDDDLIGHHMPQNRVKVCGEEIVVRNTEAESTLAEFLGVLKILGIRSIGAWQEYAIRVNPVRDLAPYPAFTKRGGYGHALTIG
jgi:hypothetical protein